MVCVCVSLKVLSAGQAHLPRKQQSHYGEEYGQNEEDVGGAHNCVVWQLIWLSSNLVDVEANWEYESSHTEQDHCVKKTGEESINTDASVQKCK